MRQQKEKTEKKQKPQRSPKEASALMIGVVALLFSAVGVAAWLFSMPYIISLIFGGAGILVGLVGLLFGKGGTLPSAVAIAAGFMCILGYIILKASGNA